jgi:hypothetical protein
MFPGKITSILNLVAGPLQQAAGRHTQQLLSSHADRSNTESLANGALYHFHIRNGVQYLDQTGSVFSSPNKAIAQASVIAAELAQDGSWDASSIYVMDEQGNEIARVPIHR